MKRRSFFLLWHLIKTHSMERTCRTMTAWKVSSDKTFVNLQKYLRQEQVSYGDLYETFQKRKKFFITKRDSHWKQQGCCSCMDTLLSSL